MKMHYFIASAGECLSACVDAFVCGCVNMCVCVGGCVHDNASVYIYMYICVFVSEYSCVHV